MVRGKVQIRRIENPVHRQVTFSKRRMGLLKKARELSVLCEADVGVIVFSAQGKLYELTTRGTMQDIIERYKEVRADTKAENGDAIIYQEMHTLKKDMRLLQKGLRCIMLGENVEDLMLDELEALERHLEMCTQQIQSAKMQLMLQEIMTLKNQEGKLKAANKFLQEKIVQIVQDKLVYSIEQDGVFQAAPVTPDVMDPPTSIQNDIYLYYGETINTIDL